jgi:TolB protein
VALGLSIASILISAPQLAQATSPGRDGAIAVASLGPGGSVLSFAPSGRGLRTLTTCTGADVPCGGSEPAWSPDGRMIAFGRGTQLWVMNADGTDARALEGVRGAEAAWAPDGKRIVFKAVGYKGEYGIGIVKADGSSGRLLTTDIRDGAPTWSPDGRRIAFTRFRDDDTSDQEIHTIAPSGKGRRRIVGGCYCDKPDYSPDGRSIAYTIGVKRRLYVAAADGSRRRRLIGGYGDSPAWSPSGRQIAFTRGSDVFVVRRDGSHAHRVPYDRSKASKGDRSARWEDPSWQPLPR